jgi:hypothetical protein
MLKWHDAKSERPPGRLPEGDESVGSRHGAERCRAVNTFRSCSQFLIPALGGELHRNMIAVERSFVLEQSDLTPAILPGFHFTSRCLVCG